MVDEVALVLALLFVLLALGVPVAATLALSGALGLWLYDFPLLIVVQRMVAGTESWVLMAIPFFILAGAIMEAGGLSRRLVTFADSLLGFMPGGLANANIGASMVFGGISGSAVADTSAIGSVMIPAMERQGYDRSYAAAVTAASAPMGMIIPPSIPMIVWSFISGQSLRELFLAGILPGLLIGLVLMAISTAICRRRGFQPHATRFSGRALGQSVVDGVLALGAPVIIIGGIVTGFFTPTEASVIAAAYALLATSLIYREFGPRAMPRVLLAAGKTSASIMLVVCGATVFSFFLTVAQVPQTAGGLLLDLAGTPLAFLLLASALLFLLGMFLDTTTTIVLVGPILAPLMLPAGVDPLVATMVFMVVLATGLVTPPVGLCLFVVASLGRLRVLEVAWQCLPFIAGMLLVAVLIWAFPGMVTWAR